MSVPEESTIIQLARHRGWPSVSVYLPTHTSGSGAEEDRIRLRNLIKTARERLTDEGIRESTASGLLKPLTDLEADEPFWRGVWLGGLALFVSEKGFERVMVESPLPEQCVVGDRFYLRPLFATLGTDSQFYALAVGKAGSHLYLCDARSITEVLLEDAPESLADELKYDIEQSDLQGTSFANAESIAGAGRATAMFHGHGGEKDVETTQMLRYLNRVEKAVTKVIGPENDIPLILLGVEDQLALYRSLNSYGNLAVGQVTGSIAELSAKEVHERALAAVRPLVEAEIDADLAKLAASRGTAVVSTDAVEIVSAAAAGRVKTIYFDDSVGPFGQFDADTLQASYVCDAEPRFLRETQAPQNTVPEECGWDLVDIAAAETVLHGGTVRASTGEGAPVEGVAALMRY